MTVRLCELEDCERKHYARGFCQFHYNQDRRADRDRPACPVDGCKRKVDSAGLCGHHRRVQLWSTPGRLACAVGDCAEPATERGKCRSHYRRAVKYGLSDEELADIDSHKFCELCGVEKPSHVDHDHMTGKTRGFLCRGCNHGLGNFKDNANLLRLAIEYLDHHAREK